MSEMIDRVAKALCADDGCSWEQFSGESHFRERAKVAIAAMREPTQEMRDAGYEVSMGSYEEESEVVWGAMIDAALGDKP